nr:hypothetical protein [Tanacetum cinerariifolium]
MIADMDADVVVVLEEAKDVAADIAKDDQDADKDNADIQGRQAESQAQIYKIDLEHANKVLSMQDEEESEPAKLKEVVDIVTNAKIITKKDKGIVIRDPEESTTTTSIIIHSEAKSKDKGIDHVNKKAKEDNAVKRYQAIKKKPQTEAQERKNMMVYLKNVAGFKIDYFKERKYPLTKFTLNQMLNNARLEVKEESEVSLELLRVKDLQESKDPQELNRSLETKRMKEMDVKSAFLYGKIEKEVYVCQPLSFEDPDFSNRVYKVEKALYGLHEAPRAWYETLSTYLLDNGFQKEMIDKTLFIKGDKRLQVKQKKDGIFISQDKYVNDILNKFGFSDVKTTSTPMETHKTLLKDEKVEDADEHLYRSMIGSLMYLTSSRHDIMFAYKKQTVAANSTTEDELKKTQEKDKIISKPDKNRKRGEAGK